MYVITFRLVGTTPGVASIAVSSSDIGAVVGLLEVAKAQYKVYQDGACLEPKQFGIGPAAGWLTAEEKFSEC